MNEIEKQVSQDALLLKSIENANSAIKLLSHYVLKNESLHVENLRNQVYIATLHKQIDDLKNDITMNYGEDKVLRAKVDKILAAPEMQKATEAVRDVRLVMSLMKLIAANITAYEGDAEIWYKYTDTVKRLDDGINYLP